VAVGTQPSVASMDQNLTNAAVQLRNVLQTISNLSNEINGQGTGLATLEAIGYSSGDATTVLNMLSYMNTIAGVYYGTATQGTDFNFNQALGQLWAGQ